MGEEALPSTRSPAANAAETTLPPGRAAPPPPSSARSSSLSPIVPRSPSLRPMPAVSPPLSPRLMQTAAASLHHNRSPSFSSNFNVVDLLASQQPNGTKPPVREWAKIPLSELVRGQQLHFIDGDTPVEEACQVMGPPFLLPCVTILACDVDGVWGRTDPCRSKADVAFTSIVSR